MPGMVTRGAILSRTLAALLALSLSLGAMQCVAGTADDSGSPAPCCVRSDLGGDTMESDTNTGVSSNFSSCLGACPGMALPSTLTDTGSEGVSLPPEPPDDRIAGRSLALDPFPPRPFLSA